MGSVGKGVERQMIVLKCTRLKKIETTVSFVVVVAPFEILQ